MNKNNIRRGSFEALYPIRPNSWEIDPTFLLTLSASGGCSTTHQTMVSITGKCISKVGVLLPAAAEELLQFCSTLP